ncbi:MAG: DUF892 family protein [Geminicoccaceae bacterium]
MSWPREGREVTEEFADGPAPDAGPIAAAQAVENEEIARYGASRSPAELAGEADRWIVWSSAAGPPG